MHMGQTPRQLAEQKVQSDEIEAEEGSQETPSPMTQTYVAEKAV
jgi:hypothetical protein